MDFSKTLIRCSSIGYIMTEPKTKADKEAGRLSETAKTHLTDIYVSNKYGRNTDISNKYTEKGLMVEEDSITLFSRVKKQFFRKNEEHLSNHFIKGTPDLFDGQSIQNADHIIDIKSSWDIYTFFRTFTKDINRDYYWQLQGYMALTGAKSATLAYCLVNTPEVLINDEKRRLLYKMGVATEENKDYVEACEEIDRLSRYDDIPMEQRVLAYEIERNDEDIEALYARVLKCREYLAELDRTICPELLKSVA